MPYRNPEAKREQSRRYYQTHREQLDARTKAWTAAHPERKKEISRNSARKCYKGSTDAARARASQWQRDNPERVAARQVRRRARIKSEFIERVEKKVLFRRDKGLCGICGRAVDPTRFDIDHIVPLCLGGDHSYLNTRIAHPICNAKKARRMPGHFDISPAP
jgi:5-methylcytosine-specific restriction endonuclease McrA